ncbi:MAG: COR domain-containing protein [Bacteroidota bacterium]
MTPIEEANKIIEENKRTQKEGLSLAGIKIREIPEALSDCFWLQTLDLTSTLLTEIKGLEQLVNLQTLSLRNTLLREIKGLEKLVNLKTLSLQNTQLTEIKGLEKLVNLHTLNLSYTKLTEIKGLKQLVNLHTLYLSATQIKEIKGLKQLVNLQTLTLSYTKLTEIKGLDQLLKLHTLNLSDNKLTEIKGLEQLVNLQTLDLSNTQLSEIKGLEQLVNLQTLDLSRTQLSEIKGLEQLVNLQGLDLSQTRLSEIKGLEQLVNLQGLGLENTYISEIKELEKLPNMKTLILKGTKINEIQGLEKLKNLQRLDLRNTQIVTLKPLLEFIQRGVQVKWKDEYPGDKEICLFKNPLTHPPIEIAKQGNEAILNYFEGLEKEADTLYEAKLLILGEGGAGKTSLFKKLQYPFKDLEDTPSTEGIDIHAHEFECGQEKPFRINLWDFGGQEIYHTTHQFFLTKRSLYVLVTDGRKEDTDFNYWLRTVETFSDNSPVIILQNVKEGRRKDINQRGLTSRFTNLINPIYYVDLKLEPAGLGKLRAEIYHQIQQLEHVGTELPANWIQIREALEEREGEDPHISLRDYYKLCKQEGMEDREKAKFLSQFLHDLGVILHFQDDAVLQNTLILKNEWATDGVYRILDNPKVRSQNGQFSLEDANEVWDEEEYEGMQAQLISLMKKFELCYEVPDSPSPQLYIAPQLLQVEQPEYAWKATNNLELRYEYDFMPKGILSRFMVRKHRLIEDIQTKAWRSGVILKKGNTRAEVTETYGKSFIRVRVEGEDPRELMTIIREEFDSIHASFPKLKVDAMIPCICEECLGRIARGEEPHFYKYEDLKRRQRKGKKTVECGKSYGDVSVDALLEAIFTDEASENDIKKLVSEGRLEEALLLCQEVFQQEKEKDWLIKKFFSSNRLVKEWQDGTITRETRKVEKNRLAQDILKFLENRNKRGRL